MQLTKGYKQLIAEARAKIRTLSQQEALALHGDPDVLFVDIRDVRELEREGTVPGWTLSNLNCAGASVAPVYAGSTVTVTLSTQESITCSYTNTRASATLTLRKQWVGSTAGDQATLVADALEQPTYATATSTAPGGDALDTTNVVTIPIYSGDSIALSETVADGLGDNYATTLDCGGVSIPLTDLRGTYAVPTVPANVTCTFVNTDVRPKLTLVKQLPNTAGGTVTLANFPLTAANQAEPVAISMKVAMCQVDTTNVKVANDT